MILPDNVIVGPPYGTVEWSDFRRGLVTATGMDAVMTDSEPVPEELKVQYGPLVPVPRFRILKSGELAKTETPGYDAMVRDAMKTEGVFLWGKGAKSYMRELVAAAITGVDKAGGKSLAMERGVDMEADAIDYYAQRRFVEVGEGRILRIKDTIIAATPDGFVDEDKDGPGLLEVKCPNSDTHLDTYWNQAVPDQYRYQIQAQLMVTGRGWCDFLSFDDRWPEPIKSVIIRVRRNEELIAEMNTRVRAFAEVVTARIDQLREVIAKATPAEVQVITDALNADQPEEL